jgi:hypothetical protein
VVAVTDFSTSRRARSTIKDMREPWLTLSLAIELCLVGCGDDGDDEQEAATFPEPPRRTGEESEQ